MPVANTASAADRRREALEMIVPLQPELRGRRQGGEGFAQQKFCAARKMFRFPLDLPPAGQYRIKTVKAKSGRGLRGQSGALRPAAGKFEYRQGL